MRTKIGGFLDGINLSLYKNDENERLVDLRRTFINKFILTNTLPRTAQIFILFRIRGDCKLKIEQTVCMYGPCGRCSMNYIFS